MKTKGKNKVRLPDIRLQLVHPDGEFGMAYMEKSGAIVRQGPAGLLAVVSYFHQGAIHYPRAEDLAATFGDVDAAFDKAVGRTRMLLAQHQPRTDPYGPLIACFYDNDVPGYAGSRLYYPELIVPTRYATFTVFVVAFDRDLLVAILAMEGDEPGALALMRQVRELRRGHTARPLLPDQHFLLSIVDGASVLMPIDVTAESTLRGLILPTS